MVEGLRDTRVVDLTTGIAGAYATKLFADAGTTVDVAKRKDLYFKGQAILARDLPAFPVVDRGLIDFARPEVGGVVQSPYMYWVPALLWRRS